MKYANVTTNVGCNAKSQSMTYYNRIILENIEDLQEYFNYTQDEIVEGVRIVLKSNVSPDSYDHLVRQNVFGGLLATSFTDCQMKGGNPLINLDKVVTQKFINFTRHILAGEKIMLNQVGGYCFVGDGTIEWINAPDNKLTCTINTGTKYINLENDPVLEQYSKDYLSLVDKNYSYVTNMFRMRAADFNIVFNDFVDAGGTTVFVYTTGMDVDQMFVYFDSAVDTGIKNFEFVFNADITPGIKRFLRHVSARAKNWSAKDPNGKDIQF